MIRVENLTKSFKVNRKMRKELGDQAHNGRITAVDNVSFECEPGRVFGLLGPNGAGKTTALRMIATMLRPTSGRFFVDGVDGVADPRGVRGRIGFMTGNTGLYDRLTATEMVKYFADLHRMDQRSYEKRRDELYDRLDMHGFANQRVAQLSTGMKQKVSIAALTQSLAAFAQNNHDFQEANRLFETLADHNKRYQDDNGLGSTYHHLGMIAEAQHDFDRAEQWYRKSLAIKKS